MAGLAIGDARILVEGRGVVKPRPFCGRAENGSGGRRPRGGDATADIRASIATESVANATATINSDVATVQELNAKRSESERPELAENCPELDGDFVRKNPAEDAEKSRTLPGAIKMALRQMTHQLRQMTHYQNPIDSYS